MRQIPPGTQLPGLIFGGAYLRKEICVSKSIGLPLYLEENLPFLLCFTLYLRAISKYKPLRRAYIWRGDLMEGFLRFEFGGLLFGGAYKWRGLFSEFYGTSFSALWRSSTVRLPFKNPLLLRMAYWFWRFPVSARKLYYISQVNAVFIFHHKEYWYINLSRGF